MKVNCEIVQDLLPLYADEVCSESSKRAVVEHLQKCEKCRKMVEMTQSISVLKFEPNQPKADKAIKEGFKKIRVRWWASIALVTIVCTVVFGIWNHYHQPEIPKITDEDFEAGSEFMELLCQGNYEKAYEYIDMEKKKQEWIEDWFEEEELANIKEEGLVKFCELGAKLEELGGIEEYRYSGKSIYSYQDEEQKIPAYRLEYRILFNEKWQSFALYMSEGAVAHFGGGGSLWVDPLAAFSSWTEFLWQDYAGCYYDTELRQYVYYDKE